MIYEEFLNFLDSGYLIDGKFIKMFVENYIKNNNLEKHYDGVLIDFLSPYMGAYLLDQKKIIINLDLFVKNAIFEEKGIKLPNIYELFYYYINKSYGKNLIPLNEYNLLTNENIKPIKGLDTYNKIMYGMPINELEYEKVKKIEYAKVNHKYIKEYLNS